MKYQQLYDLLKDRDFVVVNMKNGAVVETGFVYEVTDFWKAYVPRDDKEAFDQTIDRFINQRPAKHMLVWAGNENDGIVVRGALVSGKDFAAGYATKAGDAYITTVTGKEITLS